MKNALCQYQGGGYDGCGEGSRLMESLIDCCIDCPNADKPENNCYQFNESTGLGEPCYQCPKQQEWWRNHKEQNNVRRQQKNRET